jgi:putative ABC transport system permease protein
LILVVVAITFGLPVSLWATNNWLQNFAVKVQISWWLYVLAASGAILIALLAVSSQAVKAAIQSPVKSLRSE